MTKLKLADAPARYGMRAASFERLLVKVGWMTDRVVSEGAVSEGYLTEEGELTPQGVGFLDGYSRR